MISQFTTTIHRADNKMCCCLLYVEEYGDCGVEADGDQDIECRRFHEVECRPQ